MRRLLLLPLGLLLCGAVPVQVEPPQPRLGLPFTLIVTLPDTETELAGLPPLGSCELLLPPTRDGATLRLLLLPLRPGALTLPSLPLRQGATVRNATVPLQIEVRDDLSASLSAAPLHDLPQRPVGRRNWLVVVALAVAATTLVWSIRRRRRAPQAPPLPEAERRLADLARRLEQVAADDATVATLRRSVERLRFGPLPPSTAEIDALEVAITTLGGEDA